MERRKVLGDLNDRPVDLSGRDGSGTPVEDTVSPLVYVREQHLRINLVQSEVEEFQN